MIEITCPHGVDLTRRGCRICDMPTTTTTGGNLAPRFRIVDQPAPVPSDRPAIVDLVVADLDERKRLGIERYGTPLQAHNGRDALVDAYQEALDLCCYLRQAIEERR